MSRVCAADLCRDLLPVASRVQSFSKGEGALIRRPKPSSSL